MYVCIYIYICSPYMIYWYVCGAIASRSMRRAIYSLCVSCDRTPKPASHVICLLYVIASRSPRHPRYERCELEPSPAPHNISICQRPIYIQQLQHQQGQRRSASPPHHHQRHHHGDQPTRYTLLTKWPKLTTCRPQWPTYTFKSLAKVDHT